MFDTSALSPEEKDSLLQSLIEKYNSDPAPEDSASPDHPDEAADNAWIQPVVQAIQYLIDAHQELSDKVQKLESMVLDDLFGGIEKLYQTNLRAQSMQDLQGKYGDLFAPHMDALKELAPGEDLWESIQDLMDQNKDNPDWNDETKDSTIKNMAQGIADKIAKIKGEAAPAEGAVKVMEVAAAPEETPEQRTMRKIKEMRAKAPKDVKF